MAQFGGFWLRLVAYVIDAIVLNIASTIVGAVTGFSMGMSMYGADGTMAGFNSSAQGLGFLVVIVGGWLYFALMESSSWQGTLGKKAIGLMVTDDLGRRITFGRATGRYFAKIVSGIILGIGFLMVAFTQRKQGLHDMIAGTLVYKARDAALITTNPAVFE